MSGEQQLNEDTLTDIETHPDNSQASEISSESLDSNSDLATAGGEERSEQGVTLEQLQAALEDAQQKAQENWEGLLRTRAELENQRKRSAREVENALKFGSERLVSEFLPVKDSLELGLSASEQAADLESLKEGMTLTLKLLNSALDKCSVKEVNPVGEKFDPQFHQAMTVQEAPETEPGTVLSVVQKGYLLHDRLLRPAMVIVAKSPEP
ncbi:MAG: nucleotide exchange factor GrpE [Thermodesulfobacteriota bacterium]